MLADGLLDRRGNALNLIRLMLATVVIVDHAWPLGGFGEQPRLGTSEIGHWAVAGFFCVSGFLIASSRVKLSFPRFLWHRALRIMPGFWVCLLVVAFGFAPLAAWLAHGETYSPASAVWYVTRNAALWMNQWGIEGTLAGVPYRDVWDGSLWTLGYEFLAYIAAGVVLTGWLRRHPAATSTVLLVVVIALGVLLEGRVSIQLLSRGLWLGAFFLAGMVAFGFCRALPARWWLAAASTACIAVVAVFEVSSVWAALPLAYLMLWLGAGIPAGWSPQRNDVSYGVYIYAFPIQQALVLAGAAGLGLVPFIVLSAVCTVPLAWVSWRLVEAPAQRLKHAGLRRRPAVNATRPGAPAAPAPEFRPVVDASPSGPR